MTAPDGDDQVWLFPIPDAYQPSAWRYVPNPQDACTPVDLDEAAEVQR